MTEWTEVSGNLWLPLGPDGEIVPASAIWVSPDIKDVPAYLDGLANPPPEPRKVPKSVIVSRLIAADKIAAAKAALDTNPAAFARWFASDRPAVNFDDPDAIALLKAIGADPDSILAP